MNIKKVEYHQWYTDGCETCDYGSHYVNDIEITLENDTYINIKVDKMYDYTLSESDYIQLLANNKNVNDLIVNIIKKIKNKRYNEDLWCALDLEDLTIKVNNKKIDIIKTFKMGQIVYEHDF